jgi:DNA-binding transcriptional ArsR family regulator
MGSPWKAISDDGRREILLLKKKAMVPTEIAEHFNFTLPALSSHLRILKDADLITEKKHGKNLTYLSCLNSKHHQQQIFAYDSIICWASDIYKYIAHTYIVYPIWMEK